MSAKVYTKPARRADNNALLAEGENLVIFDNAELYVLRNALDEQLDQHAIKGLKRNLVTIVFRQTLPFHKRVEDMNSIRLQNLARSRGDYCYRGVDELVERSILLEEPGYHGKMLSVNYNFSQWDQSRQESLENGGLISDPEALLETLKPEDVPEDKLQEMSEETGQATSEETSQEIIPDTEDDTAKHPDKNNLETSVYRSNENRLEATTPAAVDHAEIQGLQSAIQALRLELSNLKSVFQQFLPNLTANINRPQTAAIQPAIQPAMESAGKTESCDIPCEISEPKPHKPIPEARLEPCKMQADENHKNETCSVEMPVSKPLPTPVSESLPTPVSKPLPTPVSEPLPTPVSKPLPTPVSESLSTPENPIIAQHPQENPACENETQALCEAQDLEFPEALKPHEKKAICKALETENIADKSQCQLLLDDLKSRYEISDWQPIRSPVAYFKSLIRSLKDNCFVADYAHAYREQQEAASKEAERQTKIEQQREQQAKRKEAYYQYRQAAFLASSDGCSLRDMAKRLSWESVLESMGFDLEVKPAVVLNGT